MRPLGLLSALPFLVPSAGAQSFLDWEGLKPGPHVVGFRSAATTDATRTWLTPTDYRGRARPGFGNRPVQISIWYPANVGPNAQPMTYGDYVDLLAWETGPENQGSEEQRLARAAFQRMSGLEVSAEGEAAFEKLYAEKVRATHNATPAAGKYPVLISAPGQGYPAFDNSVMAEYLASHGFIVVASPSMGPEGRDMPDGPLAIQAESRDMEYLLGYAQGLEQADPDRIAAMGFSLGGASASLFALGNARVKALISLDGVLRDDRYLPTLRAFPQFSPERLRGALLWIACGPTTSLPGFGEGSFPEEARYAEAVKAVFPGLHHHDFSSMSSLQRRRAGDPTKDWTSATASYEAASRLILAFLETRLAGKDTTLPGDPAYTLSVRPAKTAPPSPTDFREVAANEGFAAAAALLEVVQKNYPEALPRFEESLVLLAYEALAAHDLTRAAQAFRLALEAAPNSIDGSYGLAKTCQAQGALDEAATHYSAARTKVEKDPNLSADQKAGILGRIDKILADLKTK